MSESRSQWTTNSYQLTHYPQVRYAQLITGFRLVLGAILLTAKFYNDVYYSNLNLAHIAGLPLSDLNQIESEFLTTIDYGIFISPEEYQRFELGLQSHSTSQTSTRSSSINM